MHALEFGVTRASTDHDIAHDCSKPRGVVTPVPGAEGAAREVLGEVERVVRAQLGGCLIHAVQDARNMVSFACCASFWLKMSLSSAWATVTAWLRATSRSFGSSIAVLSPYLHYSILLVGVDVGVGVIATREAEWGGRTIQMEGD